MPSFCLFISPLSPLPFAPKFAAFIKAFIFFITNCVLIEIGRYSSFGVGSGYFTECFYHFIQRGGKFQLNYKENLGRKT